MWAKIISFVAGAVIATVVTLWMNSKEDQHQNGQKQGNNFSRLPPPDGPVIRLENTSDDVLVCAICLENAKTTVFEPCGHICSCHVCALRLNDCPICRQRIQHIGRVYLA